MNSARGQAPYPFPPQAAAAPCRHRLRGPGAASRGRTRGRRLAALLLLLLCLFTAAAAHAQCAIDTVFRNGFDRAGADLTLDGMVAGITAGTVELRSGDTVFGSATATDGYFSLDLPTLPAGAMLELRARGLADNGQDFVELASYLGRAGDLFDHADPDGHLRVTGLAEIALTSRNTALYALAKLASPTPLADECEYRSRVAALADGDVTRHAAVVQIDIADGGFSNASARLAAADTSPSTTLELLLDAGAFDDEAQAIDDGAPGRVESQMGVNEESFCDRFSGDALMQSEGRANGTTMNASGEEIYRRIDATSGTNINGYGKDSYTWTCDGTQMRASLAGARVSVDYPVRVVNGVPQQVYAEVRTSSVVLQPIEAGAAYMVVAERAVSHVTFPYEPTLPDEYPIGEGRMVILRAPVATPFSAASIPGDYLLPVGTVQINTLTTPAVDRVTLASGGTGSDLDTGASLTWSVVGGKLVVDFADRQVAMTPMRDEAANVADVFSVLELNDGRAFVSQSLVPRKTSTSFWANAAAVPGTYLQVAGRVQGEDTARWVTQNDAARSADLWVDYFAGAYAGQSFLTQHAHWSYVSPNTVVLRHCVNGSGQDVAILDREPAAGECTAEYFRRSWTLYTAAANTLYVLEDIAYWYEDPTLGHAPWSLDRRAYFYQRGAS